MVREKDTDSDDSDSTLSNRVSSGPPSGISNGKTKIGRGRGRGRLKTQSSNSNYSGFSTKKSGVSLASSNGSGSQSQSQSGTNDLSSLTHGSNDSESKSAFSDLKSGKSSISNQLSIGMSRFSMNSSFSGPDNGPKIRKVSIFFIITAFGPCRMCVGGVCGRNRN